MCQATFTSCRHCRILNLVRVDYFCHTPNPGQAFWAQYRVRDLVNYSDWNGWQGSEVDLIIHTLRRNYQLCTTSPTCIIHDVHDCEECVKKSAVSRQLQHQLLLQQHQQPMMRVPDAEGTATQVNTVTSSNVIGKRRAALKPESISDSDEEVQKNDVDMQGPSSWKELSLSKSGGSSLDTISDASSETITAEQVTTPFLNTPFTSKRPRVEDIDSTSCASTDYEMSEWCDEWCEELAAWEDLEQAAWEDHDLTAWEDNERAIWYDDEQAAWEDDEHAVWEDQEFDSRRQGTPTAEEFRAAEARILGYQL